MAELNVNVTFPKPAFVPAASGGGSGGTTTADKVSYDGSFDNVQEALDDLFYAAPSINSFTGGSSNEIGSTITAVNLAWTLNKDVTSQSLNQGIGAIGVALRAHALSDLSLTTNTTYTLTVGDGTNTDVASTSVSFLNKCYWGVSTETELDDAAVLALDSQLSSSRVQSRTFDCSGGRYFYFAFPASFGTPTFKVGGLAFSAMTSVVRNFENASGHTASFQIWRVNDIQTGSAIAVEVS